LNDSKKNYEKVDESFLKMEEIIVGCDEFLEKYV